MMEKRTKIFIFIFLVLAVLVILIPAGKTRIESPQTPSKNGQAPIRKVDITLSQSQHDQFFEQLRKFADKHAFAIRIAQTDPTGENFLVQMWREDIKVIGVDSGDPELFLISFFSTSEERPAPSWALDQLIVELKEFIGEIPGTTFTVVE